MLFAATRAFYVFMKSAKFLLYFTLLRTILLDPEIEDLKEIYYLTYLVLGEGVSNISFLFHVSASCIFFFFRVTIKKCPY